MNVACAKMTTKKKSLIVLQLKRNYEKANWISDVDKFAKYGKGDDVWVVEYNRREQISIKETSDWIPDIFDAYRLCFPVDYTVIDDDDELFGTDGQEGLAKRTLLKIVVRNYDRQDDIGNTCSMGRPRRKSDRRK